MRDLAARGEKPRRTRVRRTVCCVGRDDDGANPLQSLDSFKAFTGSVRERCDELPVNRRVVEVGSHRVFEP
jgi:hypothetical protein